MEKFIGTKIVQAEPYYRVTVVGGKTPGKTIFYKPAEELASSEKYAADHGLTWEAEEGYKVVYEGGHESWSPRDVFEAAYRRTDGMNFGLAIEAAKMGKKISRAGWNGEGQYVELGHNFGYSTTDGTSDYAIHQDIGSTALVFVGTRGRQVGWLASQADMLADDWYIVE
ncbi:MAG: DUF2829 domain-containing protein [Oscillospiraceae bacterium]|nr:DUF2829 domain-containing protein [Oscillospiraceae bacterium]